MSVAGFIAPVLNRFGGYRRDLPLGRDVAARYLAWVLGLMAYIAGLGGVGLVSLNDTLQGWERSVAGTMTLQVPAETSKARLETVLALLRQTPGIASAHLLEPKELAGLLEPWLGPTVPLDELPVPRLIDLRIDPNGGPDLATLRRQLASVVPEARLDDYSSWIGDLRGAARRIATVLIATIVAAFALIAVLAVYATGIGLTVGRATIELVHLLGAPDRDIAGPFEFRALRLGLIGGALGAVAALFTTIALGSAARALGITGPLGWAGLADWRLWAVVIGIVLGAGLVALASARLVVRRRLGRIP